MNFLRIFILVSFLFCAHTIRLDSDNTLEQKAQTSPYFWPMARGPVGSHATSPFKGPRDVSSSLMWSWSPPQGPYKGPAGNGAALIDDMKNVYSEWGGVIRKFSPEGKLLWEFALKGGGSDIPALMDGALYSSEGDGHAVAISMETGTLLWRSAQVCSWDAKMEADAGAPGDCRTIGFDIGAVGVHNGIVTIKTHQAPGGGAVKTAGLNASNGEFVWDYAPDHMIWNYYPIVSDDGNSFVFQDHTGEVYRVGLDGKQLWKAGVSPKFPPTPGREFTDGGLQIGPNGVLYAMKAIGGNKHGDGPGLIRAFRMSDGKMLWQSEITPEVPNAWPVVGRMRKDDPLTVIAPSGQCGGFFPRALDQLTNPLQRILTARKLLGTKDDDFARSWGTPEMQPEIWGLDAETGETLWKWRPPIWKQGLFRGEYKRISNGQGPCMPNPVGNPTMDKDGNFYVGMLDGFVYHLVREDNGPGVRVQSKYDAESAFSSGGVSIAPGMMVIQSCETLMAFKGEA